MSKHIILLAAVLAGVAPRGAQAQFDPRGVVRPRAEHADQWYPPSRGGFEEPRDPIIDIFIVAGGYAGYTLGKNQEHSEWFGGKAPVWSVLTGMVVGAVIGKQVQDHYLGEDYSRRRLPGYHESANFVRLRGNDTLSVETVSYDASGIAQGAQPGSIAMDERMTQRAVSAHQTEFLTPSGAVTRVRTLSPGVLHVDFGGSDLQAEMNVDSRGRIQSATYMSKTDVVTVRRTPVRAVRPR